jgi:hypothetical protein
MPSTSRRTPAALLPTTTFWTCLSQLRQGRRSRRRQIPSRSPPVPWRDGLRAAMCPMSGRPVGGPTAGSGSVHAAPAEAGSGAAKKCQALGRKTHLVRRRNKNMGAVDGGALSRKAASMCLILHACVGGAIIADIMLFRRRGEGAVTHTIAVAAMLVLSIVMRVLRYKAGPGRESCHSGMARGK